MPPSFVNSFVTLTAVSFRRIKVDDGHGSARHAESRAVKVLNS